MIQVAELIYIVPEKREAVLQQFLSPSVEEQRVAWTYGIRNKCFYRMNEMILETFDYVGKDFHKDMQEYKEMTFYAIDTVKDCILLFTGMADTMKFNSSKMEASARLGFTNATDAADYLVKKGMPFRDAHSVIGRLVLYCIEKNCAIDDLSIEELKEISDVFEADVFDAISLKTCVEKRLTTGAPGPEQMKDVIEVYHKYLKKEEES